MWHKKIQTTTISFSGVSALRKYIIVTGISRKRCRKNENIVPVVGRQMVNIQWLVCIARGGSMEYHISVWGIQTFGRRTPPPCDLIHPSTDHHRTVRTAPLLINGIIRVLSLQLCIPRSSAHTPPRPLYTSSDSPKMKGRILPTLSPPTGIFPQSETSSMWHQSRHTVPFKSPVQVPAQLVIGGIG